MLDLMLCLGRRTKRNKDTIANKMLVSESSIFGQTLRVLVVTAEGREWALDVDPDCSVDKIKGMALGHFYHPAETLKTSSHYQLVLADRKLNDNLSLTQEGVRDNDELLLLKRIIVPHAVRQESESNARDSQWKGPDVSAIRLRTSHLTSKNENRVAEDSITVVNFQVELRKALVSLIDCAQRIQMMNKNALPLFAKYPESSSSDDSIDPSALKQLTDMGFSTNDATQALLLNNMSSVDALECLLLTHHIGSTDAGRANEMNKAQATTSSTSQVDQSPEKQNEQGQHTNAPKPPSAEATVTAEESVHLPSLPELMEAFRAYKRREFRPNHKAFTNLREMGFDQEKIADALRVSGNNQDAAFEWLISQWPTVQDFSQGLDPEGPIHGAIMANPVIRLGLNSPKVLYAFLHMLENPNCANHWLNDPDAAPLLSQIFKIYHAEKYSLQIGNS